VAGQYESPGIVPNDQTLLASRLYRGGISFQEHHTMQQGVRGGHPAHRCHGDDQVTAATE
jgi:hypothetical protein